MVDDQIMKISELNEKYEAKLHFTELWGIIDAIPKDWLQILKKKGGSQYKNWYKLYSSFKSMVKI